VAFLDYLRERKEFIIQDKFDWISDFA
jgi:hypothetical protein